MLTRPPAFLRRWGQFFTVLWMGRRRKNLVTTITETKLFWKRKNVSFSRTGDFCCKGQRCTHTNHFLFPSREKRVQSRQSQPSISPCTFLSLFSGICVPSERESANSADTSFLPLSFGREDTILPAAITSTHTYTHAHEDSHAKLGAQAKRRRGRLKSARGLDGKTDKIIREPLGTGWMRENFNVCVLNTKTDKREAVKRLPVVFCCGARISDGVTK